MSRGHKRCNKKNTAQTSTIINHFRLNDSDYEEHIFYLLVVEHTSNIAMVLNDEKGSDNTSLKVPIIEHMVVR
eukprot:scaffold155700_cov21-Prasinocladus_malaysianus.AAC.2